MWAELEEREQGVREGEVKRAWLLKKRLHEISTNTKLFSALGCVYISQIIFLSL